VTGAPKAGSVLAVFDMDLTLTERASWTPFLFHYARSEAPWRLFLAPFVVVPLVGFAIGFHGRKGLKEASQRLLMGRRAPRWRVERAARRFADRWVARHERPTALAAIAAARAEGHAVLIATASAEFYANAIAERWGVGHLVATRNHWDGAHLTPRIAGENCYGMGKLRMVLAALTRRPDHVLAYSDHASDLPLLLWADEAVAVSPAGALRRAAQARGWTISAWGARERRTVR
jgi:HAD superfamily hydrolase (TIGR01490 family)